ncbi:MAG: cache domain-containing protein, partial [Treponema sp.]|nr:cache domain-containing protein [Treponema sp.]
MPEISKRNFFSSMKDRLSRYRITIINVSVTVILIGIVIFVMLNRASSLQRQTAEESIVNLAGITANEVQSVYLTYYDILRTTSQIMRNYQNIEVDQRRAFVKSLMREIIYSNTSLVNIYSLWKPDALDGMDSEYINTADSDETGQFISGYTRENGFIEQKAFKDYRYILSLNYDELGRDSGIIREPFPMTGLYLNSWGVDIQVAIVSDTDVVGVIGATINLEVLQYLIESKTPFGTGRTMVVTPRGTLVAHTNPGLRGASFMAKGAKYEDQESLFSVDTALYVFSQIQKSMDDVEPVSFRVSDTLVVSYPLRSTDPITAAYHTFMPKESGVPHWAVVTAVPMPAILAPVNALLRFSILFIISAGILTAFIVFLTYRGLSQQTQVLQHDLERATTMQDNLKYGLFLMDQQFVIQGVYSRALEKIMSVSNLQGKVFTDLLSSSLKGQEKEGVADYLEMIFKRSFDKEMLDEINPIDTFTYISTETGETKNLRTSFTLAERGRGAAFILVTLEDISAEKKLEKQLFDAENQKE